MKRLIVCIFVPILAVLLMSHNTFATTANIAPGQMRVHRVQRNNFSIAGYENYPFTIKNNTLGFAVAVVGQNWSIRSMSLPLGTTIENESYYSMSLTLVNSYVGTLAGLGCNKIDDVSYVQGTTSDTTIFVRGHVVCDVTNLEFGDNNNPNMVFLHGTSTEEGIWVFQPKINFFEYQDQAAEQINKWKEEEKQKLEDATNDSSQAGDSSQSDAQGATNSLLSVIGGFANIITNASPTSCVINAPLNTSFSNDNFNVDLCGLDLPPGVAALTSIVAIMVVVPFAISMFNKFIGIIESFQR